MVFGVLGAFAIATPMTMAQGVPNSPYLSVAQRSAFLVANPDIETKIHLTSAQHKAILLATKRYSAVSEKLSASKDPAQKAFEENDLTLANAYLNTLNPVQKEEVLRLGVQKIGTEALTDTSIAQRVGLNPSQANKIASLFRAFNKRQEDVDAMVGVALAAIPEPKTGKDQAAYEEKQKSVTASYEGERQRLRKEKALLNNQVLNILNATQKKVWLHLAAVPTKKK